MAKLIDAAIASLDGYVEDQEDRFDWSAPDVRDDGVLGDRDRRRRSAGSVLGLCPYLAGSRQVCVLLDASEGIERRTRIERVFDRDAIQRRRQSSGADIAIGGAELAGQAIGAGLVDECHLFLCPIVVGGVKRALPDNIRVQLEPSMCAGSETASFTSTIAQPLTNLAKRRRRAETCFGERATTWGKGPSGRNI